jgi:hypothetical protein
MVDGYEPPVLEAKWQERWAADGFYNVDNDDPRPHWYTLCMYPYPSGAAHMGHVRNYTFGDLIVRYRTMNGYAVLSPMGFDSFGLPAENAAIKTGRHPREFTDERIEMLRSSILRIGAVYDWRRQVTSHSVEYQKWTQWIFLKFLEAGLAYRRNAPVNWCPGCQTVLANEQVNADGTCDRSGDVVEKRDLEQWFFKITDYAQQLLDDLDDLDWPERVKIMQRNWIGRSEGAEFSMQVVDSDGAPHPDGDVARRGKMDAAERQRGVAIPAAGGGQLERACFRADGHLDLAARGGAVGKREPRVVATPAGGLPVPGHRIGRVGPEADPMVAGIALEFGLLPLDAGVEGCEHDPPVGELLRLVRELDGHDGRLHGGGWSLGQEQVHLLTRL